MYIGIKGSNNEPQGTTKMARNEREPILRTITGRERDVRFGSKGGRGTSRKPFGDV
jgi:hypothetical protein